MKHLAFIALLFTSLTGFSQDTWERLDGIPPNTNGTRYDDLFFLNENLGWIANGFGSNVFRTTDGGATFTEIFSKDEVASNIYYRNIEFFDESVGVLTSLSGKHFRTSDAGDSWQDMSIPNDPEAICGLSRINAQTMIGCGAFNTPAFVVKTTDTGKTWTYTDLSEMANALVEVKFFNENIGYASGRHDNGGIVLKTIDGGISWSSVFISETPGEYVWKLQFVEDDPNVIYGSIEPVPNENGKVIKSFDAGQTWETQETPVENMQAIGFIDQNRGWVGGHTSNLFETTDGGDTWTDLGYGINANRIFFVGETAYCSAATVFKLNSNVLSTPSGQLQGRRDLPVVIAPLPVKESLKFSVTYFGKDNALIELYDINGKLIDVLKRVSSVSAGETSYDFPFTYPSGTYILSIQNNTGRQSVQFVKN